MLGSCAHSHIIKCNINTNDWPNHLNSGCSFLLIALSNDIEADLFNCVLSCFSFLGFNVFFLYLYKEGCGDDGLGDFGLNRKSFHRIVEEALDQSSILLLSLSSSSSSSP